MTSQTRHIYLKNNKVRNKYSLEHCWKMSQKRCIGAQKFKKIPPLLTTCLKILSFTRWGRKKLNIFSDIKYFIKHIFGNISKTVPINLNWTYIDNADLRTDQLVNCRPGQFTRWSVRKSAGPHFTSAHLRP